MLETITKGFKNARLKLGGKAELSEDNISEALQEVRTSLLSADVEFGVVKNFINQVKEKAVGSIVKTKVEDKGKELTLTPDEHFIKICYDELSALMGPSDSSLTFAPKGKISSIMLVGLQGSGKTTTAAKLASYLKKKGHRPLLVAADVYRPAAVEQIKSLGEKLELHVFHEEGLSPPVLAERAMRNARGFSADTVIIDTAGRLAVDEALMEELENITRAISPENTLLVTDAMTGQDAVKTAAEFNRRLKLTGLIMTKFDGDARGGAALSVKAVTGVPIKFLGVGETMDRLEEFRPDGIASRILGFGDIVGLAQDFEEVVDEKEAEANAEKMLSGKFNFNDFLSQLKLIRSLGPLSDILEKLPFVSDMIPEGVKVDDREFKRIEAIINSMTPKERNYPDILNDSRFKRISRGSGMKDGDVKAIVERFRQMRKLLGNISSRGPQALSMLPGMNRLGELSQLSGVDMGDMFGSQKEERFQTTIRGGQRLMRHGQAPASFQHKDAETVKKKIAQAKAKAKQIKKMKQKQRKLQKKKK